MSQPGSLAGRPDKPEGQSVQDRLRLAARDDCPRILSVLLAKFGDLDLADDAVQDALESAAKTWPHRGIPDNAGGWLMTVARNRAVDLLRSRTRRDSRLRSSARDIREEGLPPDAGGVLMISNSNEPAGDAPDPTGGDERLRLLLLCCHPALNQEAQIALTLRLVGGLTTAEIGAAFLVPEPTVAQRIVRAKRKIRTAKIPMSLPERLEQRLDTVLMVLYLVFNEGYLSSNEQADVIRVDLVDEAVRLTRLVSQLAPKSAETLGLLALQLFHCARSQSRVDELGDLVLLDEQDRSTWDAKQIRAANRLLSDAMKRMDPGAYQLQAIIAAQHANATTSQTTDWATIADLYRQLDSMVDSPIVSLNRAIAVAMADGPLVGLRRIEALQGLEDYHLYWATKAELHLRAGSAAKAKPFFETALGLAKGPAERRHLQRRIQAC